MAAEIGKYAGKGIEGAAKGAFANSLFEPLAKGLGLITGHKSVREYRRYAGEDARGDRADAAMAKVMANRSEMLARRADQGIENAV